MQKNFLFLIVACVLFLMVNTDAWAQCQTGEGERLTTEQRIEKQAHHVANSLMLSEEMVEKFTPLYSDYLKEFRTVARTDLRRNFGKGKIDKDDLTDEQIDRLISLRFEKCRKILDVREKYYKEFKEILTPRQILKLYSIERNINKKVQGELNRRYKNK